MAVRSNVELTPLIDLSVIMATCIMQSDTRTCGAYIIDLFLHQTCTGLCPVCAWFFKMAGGSL